MDRKKPEVTTAIILEKRIINKDKKHPVKLRITYQGTRKYYTLKGQHYTVDKFKEINPTARKENKKKFESVENRAIDIIDNVLIDFSFNEEVILLPETLEIIEQLGNTDKEPDNYIFPILKDGFTPKDQKKLVAQFIQTNNKYMKRIAKNIGIDTNISIYYARHSYSTIIRDSGASTEFIAEQIGHKSTKVTQSYLDSFNQDTKEKYQKALIPK